MGITRREFSQLSILTLSTALLDRGRNRNKNTQAEKILIVGAGMAGISAARNLHDAGHNAIVLEGRDRIGGRLWTSRKWENTPLDLGASWIHGDRDNPLTKIADKINAPRQATNSNDFFLYDVAGNIVPDRLWDRLDRFEAKIWRSIKKAAQLDNDISIEAAIAAQMDLDALSPAKRRQFNFVVNMNLELESATDISELSAHYIDEGKEFRGDDVLLPQGYDALIHYLATGLDIRLNEKVTRIAYNDRRVTVSTTSGIFEADRAIVTLPIGVLKQGDVAFEPGLPAKKQTAIEALGVGVLNKTYLQFPQVFWERSTDWIGYISEEKGQFSGWLNLYPSTGKPILAAFNVGDFGRTIETFSDRQIVDRAMQTLSLMYGTDIPNPVDAQITRWFSDPFARCSYSSPVVGIADTTRSDLAEPILNRLFFAGEATNSDYPSTVHGAYLSGQREGDRIRRIVKS